MYILCLHQEKESRIFSSVLHLAWILQILFMWQLISYNLINCYYVSSNFYLSSSGRCIEEYGYLRNNMSFRQTYFWLFFNFANWLQILFPIIVEQEESFYDGIVLICLNPSELRNKEFAEFTSTDIFGFLFPPHFTFLF